MNTSTNTHMYEYYYTQFLASRHQFASLLHSQIISIRGCCADLLDQLCRFLNVLSKSYSVICSSTEFRLAPLNFLYLFSLTVNHPMKFEVKIVFIYINIFISTINKKTIYQTQHFKGLSVSCRSISLQQSEHANSLL